VEVHCGEQGRALARLWNTAATSLEASLAALQRSNAALASELAGLQEDNRGLAQGLQTLDFLRREVRAPGAGLLPRWRGLLGWAGLGSGLDPGPLLACASLSSCATSPCAAWAAYIVLAGRQAGWPARPSLQLHQAIVWMKGLASSRRPSAAACCARAARRTPGHTQLL
jgi:hypothetical protein